MTFLFFKYETDNTEELLVVKVLMYSFLQLVVVSMEQTIEYYYYSTVINIHQNVPFISLRVHKGKWKEITFWILFSSPSVKFFFSLRVLDYNLFFIFSWYCLELMNNKMTWISIYIYNSILHKVQVIEFGLMAALRLRRTIKVLYISSQLK